MGVVYYAFAAFLVPMQHELGYSTAELTGAFSLALLISGAAGIAVGRYLDTHSPRGLMTIGSIAATVLVAAWSQIDGLVAFYLVWTGLGLTMAAILYEPAFVVLAKWFPDTDQRRRAMTALTLVAALASFIFLPLSQALIAAHGWRDALLILAAILAVITIPLHALVLRAAPVTPPTARRVREPDPDVERVLRSQSFWLFTAAFFLATTTGIAMTILAIPYLIERGYSAAFAAFAVGLVGLSQIPGRVVFAALGGRLPRALALPAVFLFIAVGIAALTAADGKALVIGALVLLGMGNGMTTLARATSSPTAKALPPTARSPASPPLLPPQPAPSDLSPQPPTPQRPATRPSSGHWPPPRSPPASWRTAQSAQPTSRASRHPRPSPYRHRSSPVTQRRTQRPSAGPAEELAAAWRPYSRPQGPECDRAASCSGRRDAIR